MTDTQQRAAAKAFAKNWKDRGYEKGDSQIFWVELLTTVFGVTEISQFISFEDQVHLDHTSFIDGYIEKTHVMIEQKSINKSLTAAIRQSDGSMLTPFEQAKRYSSELPYSKRPRWIVTSNFQSFYIYDMEKPGGDPEIIQLEDLEKEYYRLQFLVDEGNTNLQREMEVSIAAGEIVGLLYDALAKQYVDPTTERAMKSLNILCVRMVFCLYAEDAGIFGQHGIFHDYLEEFDTRHMRKAVIESYNVSFHVNTSSGDLIGTDTFEDNEVKLRKGSIYRCAEYGGFGILDEINMAKNDAVSVLCRRRIPVFSIHLSEHKIIILRSSQ